MSRWRDVFRRRGSRTGLRLLGALGILAVVLLPATPAAAHAVLVEAQPADGATVARAPRAVLLRFSEDIATRFSTVSLIDRAGRPVPGTRVAPSSGDHRLLTLGLPDLPAGTYSVDWRVLAEDDGHTTGGMTVFTVGITTGAPGGQVMEPFGTRGSAPHDVARRWLSLCLLAGLIGGLAFARVVLYRAAGPVRGAVLTLATCAGVLATVAGLVDLEVQARRAGADGPALLLDTHWGRWWLVREVVIGALTVLAGTLRGARAPGWCRACWAGAAVLAVVAVTTEALTGHTAAVTPLRPLAVAVLAAHALAAFVWVGGLASLVVAWIAAGPAPGGRAALRGLVRDRFAPLAAAGVALVVATGLASAGRELGGWPALVHTAYGRVLLLKVALFLVVAALGMRNAVRPLRSRPLVAETVAGLVLLLAAGTLVETPPPRPTTPAAVTSVARSGTVADLVVSLSMTPGHEGANGVTVLAASGRRPPPAQIDDVTLDLGDGSGPAPLPGIGPGRYAGIAELPPAGAVVTATVAVRRGGTRLAVPMTWTMPGPPTPPRPSYRDGLAASGDLLGLVLLVLAAVLAAWRRTVRRAALLNPAGPELKILEDVR